jgi:hypothetical protein
VANDPTSLAPWFTFGGGAAIAYIGPKLIDFFADYSRERAKENAANRMAEEERAATHGTHALDKLGEMLLARITQLQEQADHLQARCDRLEAEKDEWQERFRLSELEVAKLHYQQEFGAVLQADVEHERGKSSGGKGG